MKLNPRGLARAGTDADTDGRRADTASHSVVQRGGAGMGRFKFFKKLEN